VLAIDRAIDELAWRPRRSLDEGLAETWAWVTAGS
jgi:nucleoside-diphosphate-sugar epimerase